MIVEVVNFLPSVLVDELESFAKQDDLPWVTQEKQEHFLRLKISWLSDSPIETAHNYFKSLHMFKHLEFIGITLWQDDKNFHMGWHEDNDKVKVAVQIYLNNNNAPGTQFKHRTISYGKNRGYILYNEKELHRVPKQTPHEGRLSIYAVYQ